MSENVRNIWKKIKKIPKQRLIRIGIISTLIIILIILITLANKSKKEIEQKEEQEKYEIVFENDSYTCEEGKEIDVMLKPKKREFPNDIYVVSSDASIATVDNNSDLKCDNCKKVVVACKKSGEAKINAIYNNKTLTTTSLNISEKEETIAFEKNNYACKQGETIEAIVKVTEGMTPNIIKSITYSPPSNTIPSCFDNTDVDIFLKSISTTPITIDENASSPATCPNCKKIRIMCNSSGNHLIEAETINGIIGRTIINVEVPYRFAFLHLTNKIELSCHNKSFGLPEIKIMEFSCKPGEVNWLHITQSTPECMGSRISDKCPKIVSWETDDPSTAEVSKETWNNDITMGHMRVGLPANGINVRVTCNKTGYTSLVAKDSNGVVGRMSIAVGTTSDPGYDRKIER